MQINEGPFRFEWIEDFAQVPQAQAAASGWAHPGMALSPSGSIITFHPGLPLALEFSPDGALLASWKVPLVEGHGIHVGSDGDQVCLWFADPGRKRDPSTGYDTAIEGPPRTLKTDLQGNVLAVMETPDLPAYRNGGYAPTGVAVFDEARGGSGDVWITDGYGRSLIHRYTRSGDFVGTINGEEGQAGAFNTPHAIHIDTRGVEPELYIADRANDRLQVYDLEGSYKRSFGADIFHHPAAFAAMGEYLVVAELFARLSILDPDDQPVAFLGDNHDVVQAPGWPNRLDGAERPVRTDRLQPGRFNSPHGVTADEDGNIYVAEWLIGGRYLKLAAV